MATTCRWPIVSAGYVGEENRTLVWSLKAQDLGKEIQALTYRYDKGLALGDLGKPGMGCAADMVCTTEPMTAFTA